MEKPQTLTDQVFAYLTANDICHKDARAVAEEAASLFGNEKCTKKSHLHQIVSEMLRGADFDFQAYGLRPIA